MPKQGSFWGDVSDDLFELGKSTTKATGQAVKSVTIGAVQKAVDEAAGSSSTQGNDRGIEQLEKGQGKKQNHTPLDMKRLEEGYKNQDQQKLDNLRNHLFNLVKSEEKNVVGQNKQEEQQRKQKEEQEIEQEKRQKLKQQETFVAPRGKERKSILGKVKKKSSQVESKANAGKQ